MTMIDEARDDFIRSHAMSEMMRQLDDILRRPPRLIACWFPTNEDDRYQRMADVLTYSASRHATGWSIEIAAIDAPGPSAGPRSHASNTHKLDYWSAVVAGAADGDRLLLVDADMFLTGPVDAIWSEDFSVAYTVRKSTERYPLNGGVVAVRVNAASRAFMSEWARRNRILFQDPDTHRPWRRRFGGMNQAALGWMLEDRAGWPQELKHASIHTVPCLAWNCEDTSWSDFDPAVTRIVHVKSGLRRQVFGGSLYRAPTMLTRLAADWHALERAMKQQQSEATR